MRKKEKKKEQKKLILKTTANWGWLAVLVSLTTTLMTAAYIFYTINLFLGMKTYFIWQLALISILGFIPIAILNYFLYPVNKTIIFEILGKEYHEILIYTTGMEIKGKYFLWKNVKSISFDTGRMSKGAFFRGFKLPYPQKMYILDNESKEYSCIIDIDYTFKNNRENNNLRKIKKALFDFNKIDIMSDWAERY